MNDDSIEVAPVKEEYCCTISAATMEI